MIPDLKDDVSYFRLLVLMCIHKGYGGTAKDVLPVAEYFYKQSKLAEPKQNAP